MIFQVAALILENTFTSILDMAGVLLPFLKYFIGGSSSNSKTPKILNFVVRSPWNTIDVIGQVLFIRYTLKSVKIYLFYSFIHQKVESFYWIYTDKTADFVSFWATR